MFEIKDTAVRKELDRVKLRLFGYGNTDCLNVSTYDRTNSILGGHRNRIESLERGNYDLKMKLKLMETSIELLKRSATRGLEEIKKSIEKSSKKRK